MPEPTPLSEALDDYKNRFPAHIREECLEEFRQAKMQNHDPRTPKQKRRDRRAEEIWEDEHAKAGWDYERQQTESDSG